MVIPTAPLNESIVNGQYRQHSQNSCSRLLPQGLNPNPQVNTCLHAVTTTTSFRASLSELNVTVNVLFSASTRSTSQLEGRGAEVTWRVSDWSTSVGCWDCLHVHLLDPDRLSAARWVAVLLVCSPAVFVSWTRGVYPWEPVLPRLVRQLKTPRKIYGGHGGGGGGGLQSEHWGASTVALPTSARRKRSHCYIVTGKFVQRQRATWWTDSEQSKTKICDKTCLLLLESLVRLPCQLRH